MDFDDLVIGSGLSALGVVLGLPRDRRILVIAGASQPRLQYYEGTLQIPCTDHGYGGLGNYWHGVIPTGNHGEFVPGDAADFERLFRRFYPRADIAGRLGSPWLFVPWRPIRPRREWPKLRAERGAKLVIVNQTAARFVLSGDGVMVETDGPSYSARRAWIGAGALGTPALLQRSLQHPVARGLVSDHVIAYLGLIDRTRTAIPPRRVSRNADGMWVEARMDAGTTSLATLRPARFAFSELDQCIEQRAAFGLPTRSAIARIVRGASAGLIAEALFNRCGLFPDARRQSVYAQINVPDAHAMVEGEVPIRMRHEVIRAATDAVRARPPWPELLPSQRPEVSMPGIHLHHSVDLDALHAAGINTTGSAVQIVDASVCTAIGPEHHSFKLMLGAMLRAASS